MAEADQSNLTTLTVALLSAYVANNNVEHAELSELIKSTFAALKAANAPQSSAPTEPEYKPAVSVRKSLGSRTHILSMIDGRPYQTLKRHLAKHSLSPQEYRERYSLPRDYPMVAPAYSESRRAIAERLGLGRKAASEAPAPAHEAISAEDQKAPAAPQASAPKPTVRKPKQGAKPVREVSPEASQATAKPARRAARNSGGRQAKAETASSKPKSSDTKAAARTRRGKAIGAKTSAS